jgi:hypothetical protein
MQIGSFTSGPALAAVLLVVIWGWVHLMASRAVVPVRGCYRNAAANRNATTLIPKAVAP